VSAGTAVSEVARGPAAGTPLTRTRALVRNRVALAVVALTALAAFLRFYRIGYQGFWFDEANTALLVHFSPGKMLGLIPQTESTPPLYYCVAWVWARVFGYGEAGLRSLSALAGVLSVPVAYGAGAKLISRPRAGLIAAALCACNPLLIWYSQEARSYALLVLLSAASLLAFAYALERPTARTAAAWVITSAFALATHYYALLVVLPEALWLLAIHRRSRPAQAAVGLVGLCGLALVPLAISQNGTGRANWIAHAPLGRRVAQIVPQFLTGFGSPAYAVLEPLALAIAIFALVLLLMRSSAREKHGALVAGSLALGGLAINLLLIAVGVDDLITRNVLAIWMPAALVIAAGLTAPRARLLGLAAAIALCAIGLTAAIGVATDRSLQRPDWRAVARLLAPLPPRPPAPVANAPARAILVQHYRDLLPLSLYAPHLAFMRHTGASVSELDVVSFSSPASSGFCWWGSACNLWPSRMQSTYPIPGFRPVWRRRIYQFTVLHMVATGGPVFLSPATVSRVLRTTSLRNDELLIQR
jgi:hypothetical protein